MGAFLLILFFIVLIIIIINILASGDQQQNQHVTTSNTPTKIDVPIRLTVSFGTSDNNVNQVIKGPRANPDSLWIPTGQGVTIQNYRIQDGLIYVGKNLISEYGYIDPALINPDLSIDNSNPDHKGTSLSYWPSYSEISPQARAAYLAWLSQGRRTPETNIGYVFLFFYGLERRLLIDAKTSSKAQSEVKDIISEVEELLKVYYFNNSFRNYALNFIKYIRLSFLPNTLDLNPACLERSWEFPLELKLALSDLSVNRKPIPHEWALAWAINDPNVWFRTPASRCKDEFIELFAKRYYEKFGAGLIVEPNATKINYEYRPASRVLSSVSVLKDKPDITVLVAPLRQIRQIAENCIDDLDAYSRFIGRKPEDAKKPIALALLPEDILLKMHDKGLDELKYFLESKLNTPTTSGTITTKDLLKFFKYEKKDKLTKAEMVSIAQLLGKFGYAIIPDIRFQEGQIDTHESVVVFKSKSLAQSVSTKTYSVSIMIMNLATAISTSDNEISKDEKTVLESQLDRILDLTNYEKERLRAYLQWLFQSPPEFTGLKRKLGELDVSQRESIASFIIQVANVDGVIQTDEIKMLKKIYGLLSLNSENIYSDIHRFQTSQKEELITIQTGVQKETGYTLPKRKSGEKKVELDENLIQRTLRDTEKVQVILAEVFGNEETQTISTESKHIGIIGLDSSHSKLLNLLLEKKKWTCEEFNSICEKCKVLPGGAIETINGRSYEIFNDALIDEGEDYEINIGLAKEIKR